MGSVNFVRWVFFVQVVIGFKVVYGSDPPPANCVIPVGYFDGLMIESNMKQPYYGDRCPLSSTLVQVKRMMCMTYYCCQEPCLCGSPNVESSYTSCENSTQPKTLSCYEPNIVKEPTLYSCCQGSEEDEFHVCSKAINCAVNNGGCDQLCRHNDTSGKDFCACYAGYQRQLTNSEGTILCTGDGPIPTLALSVTATAASTTSSPPSSHATTSLTPTSFTPTSLTPTSLTSTSLIPTSLTPILLTPTSLTPTSLTPTLLTPTSLTPTSLTPTSLTPTSLTPAPQVSGAFPVPYIIAIIVGIVLLLLLLLLFILLALCYRRRQRKDALVSLSTKPVVVFVPVKVKDDDEKVKVEKDGRDLERNRRAENDYSEDPVGRVAPPSVYHNENENIHDGIYEEIPDKYDDLPEIKYGEIPTKYDDVSLT